MENSFRVVFTRGFENDYAAYVGQGDRADWQVASSGSKLGEQISEALKWEFLNRDMLPPDFASLKWRA